MRLENIVALTQGSLLNDPFITSFDGIAFDVKKVKRGNLFIAIDSADIDDAVRNGAYGILFDKPAQIGDTEIAWIKVASVDDAMLRLLRFHLLEKEPDVYSCDPITLKLAQQIMTTADFQVVSGGIAEIFNQLWECDKGTTLLFSPSETDSNLFVSAKEIPKTAVDSIAIIEQTLFETSFIYNNVFYERQLLSPFFIPYLERLLHFFKMLKIEFRLRPFTPIAHFEAVFTNSRFQVKEFGATDRVIIFEPYFELIGQQIDFLERQANWAKIIYIIPSHKKQFLDDTENIFTYRCERDIIQTLKSTDFHFALIAEQDKSLLDKPLFKEKSEQLTLDF